MQVAKLEVSFDYDRILVDDHCGFTGSHSLFPVPVGVGFWFVTVE